MNTITITSGAVSLSCYPVGIADVQAYLEKGMSLMSKRSDRIDIAVYGTPAFVSYVQSFKSGAVSYNVDAYVERRMLNRRNSIRDYETSDRRGSL